MAGEYDIIGDIHGHADALVALLRKLGYEKIDDAWRHAERKAIFVGDFIDLGPDQVETVMIVRRMVENESALAIMGNHELNAIAWFLPDSHVPGEYLRPHFSKRWGKKNRDQHAAFLREVENKPELHREIVEWFLSLPLWLDLDNLRVVHACWHPTMMDYLAPILLPGQRLSVELMAAATREPEDESEKDSPKPSIFKAVEMLTKGMEVPLPSPHRFRDKYDIERNRVRVRWWDREATTYREAALVEERSRNGLPETAIPLAARAEFPTDKPIFIGHYWLTGEQAPLSCSVVCVDYSAGKGGPLCAYRRNGDLQLCTSQFVYV